MKKIVALVLAMVLGISMIGCSSNNSVATVNGEGIPLEYYKIYTNGKKPPLDTEIYPRSGDFLWCKNYIINIKIYTTNMYG